MKKVMAFILAGLVCLSLVACKDNDNGSLQHKTFKGIIVSYEQMDGTAILTLDNDATTSDIKISLSEDTLYSNESSKQKIEDQETRMHNL